MYVVEDEQGQFLSETEKIQERWRYYCANLYVTNVDVDSTGMSVIEREPDILRSKVEYVREKMASMQN